VMDPLGRLLFDGQELSSYLFQVPDDHAQWARLSEIVDQVISEVVGSGRRELPAIAVELKGLLALPPSVAVADQLVAGFDRMVKLWKSARSGLMDASRLSGVGFEPPGGIQSITRKKGAPVLWD